MKLSSELSALSTIRGYKPEDHSFILATFLRGLYYGDSWFSMVPKDIFMANYKFVIEAMLVSQNNTVMVACLKDDPDVILGYSILSKDLTTIHFCFVKSAWRKGGLATALCPSTPSTISHLTNLGKILMPKFQNVVFNPFKIT